MRFLIVGEADLVDVVQQLLATPVMETSFRAALEARWTSRDVVASLRMRGAIEERTADVKNMVTEREAAQLADVAEHGLLICALPGCEKKETTVREFKVCSFRPLFLFLFSCVVSYASRGVFRLPGGGVLQRGAWNAALDAAPQARVQGSQRSRRKTGARSVIQRHVQPH